MKILFLSSPHIYNAIDEPAKLIKDGFSKCGHDTSILMVSKEINLEILFQKIKNENFELIFTLNVKNLLLRKFIRRLYKKIDCPIAIFLLDHPAYHFEGVDLIARKFNNDLFLLSPEKDHVEMLNEYLYQIKAKRAHAIFFPWAGPISVQPARDISKEFDLVVFCSIDTEISSGVTIDSFIAELPRKELANKFYNILSHDIYNKLDTPIIEYLESTFEIKFDLKNDNQLKIIKDFDSLVKRLRRQRLAEMIMKISEENNFKVIICGTGWANYKTTKGNQILIGNATYMEQFNLFGRSKVLLNLDPNWVHGIHDRVFNAFSMNCHVITNSNTYKFNNESIKKFIYYYNDLSQLPELTKIAIENFTYSSEPSEQINFENWSMRASHFIETLRELTNE
jgi:hypothetical protein